MAPHCGDSEEGDDLLAKTPLSQIFCNYKLVQKQFSEIN